MKGLKLLRIFGIIGYVALAVGVLMDVANMVTDRSVFSTAVTLPFYVAALAGLIADYIRIQKEKKANKTK